jgi:hypothetical protein
MVRMEGYTEHSQDTLQYAQELAQSNSNPQIKVDVKVDKIVFI